jgi:hypothetical protein
MGLFSFLGQIVSLPIKIAAAPLEIVERTFESRPNLQPLRKARRALTEKIEEAAKELDE